MESKRIYKVSFLNNGELYEIYARNVNQSNLLGFVEIDTILFGENSSVLVDPTQERLKNEFDGVKRSYIPLQAVIRIDEVEKKGISKIVASNVTKSTVTPFPGGQVPLNPNPTNSKD